MKNIIFYLLLIVLWSCNEEKNTIYRNNFSNKEQKILQVSDSIIKSAYYATLITLDSKKQPKARIVEPFLPDKNYIIWIGTNPRSRKVRELKKNSKATLHYFDKSKLAYVSLMGNAFLINDDSLKKIKFKKEWDAYYPNKNTDFILIKFVPRTLEIINLSTGLTGDLKTWKPHQIFLRM
jgi:general stress protein 26